MTKFDFASENDAYRDARADLLVAEIALKDQTERVAALRRALPLGMAMPNYIFREGPADLNRNDAKDFTDVRFADLFTGGHDTLIVDHFMYGAGGHLDFFGIDESAPCPMCSMWADGYNAVAPHVMQRASFVLVAKAEIGRLRAFAHGRGWDRIRLISSHDNTFNRDLGVEDAEGNQQSGVSVFTRAADGTVHHRYTISAELDAQNERGIDPYSPVWSLFDLMPTGRGEWYPSHEYMGHPTPQYAVAQAPTATPK